MPSSSSPGHSHSVLTSSFSCRHAVDVLLLTSFRNGHAVVLKSLWLHFSAIVTRSSSLRTCHSRGSSIVLVSPSPLCRRYWLCRRHLVVVIPSSSFNSSQSIVVTPLSSFYLHKQLWHLCSHVVIGMPSLSCGCGHSVVDMPWLSGRRGYNMIVNIGSSSYCSQYLLPITRGKK